MFRISRGDQESVIDVDRVDRIELAIRTAGPGSHEIDEITAHVLPSGHTSRRWGVGIKREDGSVAVEPDPWE